MAYKVSIEEAIQKSRSGVRVDNPKYDAKTTHLTGETPTIFQADYVVHYRPGATHYVPNGPLEYATVVSARG